MRRYTRRLPAIKLAVIAFVSAVVLTAYFTNGSDKASAFSGGPPFGYTGAPAESSCTDCHGSFPVNSGTGSVEILGVPHDYKPGQQYTVTVKTSQEDAILYGFEVTAINRLGTQAGTLSVTNATRTQFDEGPVGPNNLWRQYIFHTSSGLFDPKVFGSNTWSFTWTAPAQKIGKIDFYAAGNAADSNGNSGGDYIYTTSSSTLSGSALSNFDGDLASDIAFFRPGQNKWFSQNIQTNATLNTTFGTRGDRIAPGDYDGDGKTDNAVFRGGKFRIQRSTGGYQEVLLGTAADVPVPGDYDGDGKTDCAVFRASTGEWLLIQTTAGPATLTLGQTGDKPAQGDYDADGKTDIAVFRPSNATWYITRSLLGSTSVAYGSSTDRPVQGDYDGDGKTDIAVFTKTTGTWGLNRSTDGNTTVVLGSTNDVPAPADYDGDGKTDVAVYSPPISAAAGTWRIIKSSDSTLYTLTLGLNRDIPIASGYIAQ